MRPWVRAAMPRRAKLVAFVIALITVGSTLGEPKAQPATTEAPADLLWKKLENRVAEIAERSDGVMGVAIVDLTDGRTILRNADRVFPAASSIKIAVLLELYHQEREARGGAQRKSRLNDVYDFDPKVLVDFSAIMGGLTPG